MDGSALPDPASLHGVPLNKQWELLRPVIERLYLDENRPLSEVIEVLKTECGFDAVCVSWAFSGEACVK